MHSRYRGGGLLEEGCDGDVGAVFEGSVGCMRDFVVGAGAGHEADLAGGGLGCHDVGDQGGCEDDVKVVGLLEGRF